MFSIPAIPRLAISAIGVLGAAGILAFGVGYAVSQVRAVHDRGYEAGVTAQKLADAEALRAAEAAHDERLRRIENERAAIEQDYAARLSAASARANAAADRARVCLGGDIVRLRNEARALRNSYLSRLSGGDAHSLPAAPGPDI